MNVPRTYFVMDKHSSPVWLNNEHDLNHEENKSYVPFYDNHQTSILRVNSTNSFPSVFEKDFEDVPEFSTEGYNTSSPRDDSRDDLYYDQPSFVQNGFYDSGVISSNFNQMPSQYTNRIYNSSYPQFNQSKIYPNASHGNNVIQYPGYVQSNSNFIPSTHGLEENEFPVSDEDSPSDGLGDEESSEPNLPSIQSKTLDLNIPKVPPIWNPLPLKSNVLDQLERPRNKNFGKVAINMDTNLSSSTDDLLKLAGGGHLQKISTQLSAYEESPESMLHNYPGHQITRNPQRSIRIIDPDPNIINRNRKEVLRDVDSDIQSNEIDFIGEEFPRMIQDFRGLSLMKSVSPEDTSSEPSRTQQPICRYFANGFCSRGERCNFLHLEHNFNTATPIFHKTRFKNGRVPIPASRYANIKIEECVGEISDMCLDQHGCRYLQRQLDTGDASIITLIFTEVIPHIVELMSDPFGNYLCQKLIEHCSEKQRLEIVKGIAGDLVHISKNMHGTRAVQKLVEHLSSPEENDLVRKALKGSVVALIQDLNGNHVIQKCLHKMEPNDNQFIYDAVAQHCVQVSTHRHGCCVMQRCIDHGTQDQKLQLVEEIRKMALTLVQDAFGNYVVQYALDLDIPTLPTELIKQLHGKLHYLAKQKFSSNVVEKCLKAGDSECVLRVLRELMGENPDPKVSPRPLSSAESELIQQKLVDLLQDSYGNYVVQTCLSEGAIKASNEYLRMANLLRPYVHQLRNAPYVKRIHNLLNLPTNPDTVTGSEILPDGHVSPMTSPHRRTNSRSPLYYPSGPQHYPPQPFPPPLTHFQPAPLPSFQPKPRR